MDLWPTSTVKTTPTEEPLKNNIFEYPLLNPFLPGKGFFISLKILLLIT